MLFKQSTNGEWMWIQGPHLVASWSKCGWQNREESTWSGNKEHHYWWLCQCLPLAIRKSHQSSPRALMSTARLNIWSTTEISHFLIGSKAYHVTCSHESQPTTNKKYGGGVVESIKWSLRKNSTIVWRSLQRISGRKKTCHCCCRRRKDQQWVRRASGLWNAVKRRAVIMLKYCCEDFNCKSQ